MIDNIDYRDTGTSLAAPKFDRSREPMPSREELERRLAIQKRWGLCK